MARSLVWLYLRSGSQMGASFSIRSDMPPSLRAMAASHDLAGSVKCFLTDSDVKKEFLTLSTMACFLGAMPVSLPLSSRSKASQTTLGLRRM